MITDLIHALVMGLVEGLTEFLPISSTGHLILTGHLIGFTGDKANTFSVFIQLGAILAVVVYFRKTFMGLVKPSTAPGFNGHRGVFFLFLTTLPAVIFGLLAHGLIKEHLFQPSTVAIGLAAGAIWILVTEYSSRQAEPQGLTSLAWHTALGIGLFQCLALWPGMSRSASTILGAMILGFDRKAATEYSFFAAVPVMFAATLYDLYKALPSLNMNDIPLFIIGFLTAGISAWFAIQFLIRFVSRHTLATFAWYRLVVAAAVFLILGNGG